MFILRCSKPVGKTYEDKGYWDYFRLSLETREQAIDAAIEHSSKYEYIVMADESNPLDTEYLINGKWALAAPEVLDGKADTWFETGSEGVYWVVRTNEPYKNLLYHEYEMLNNGDKVTIYDDNGVVYFDGIIEQDTETGYQPYPMNPQWGQQCAAGMWVHWIQSGFEPDDWGRLFLALKDRGLLNIRLEKKHG